MRLFKNIWSETGWLGTCRVKFLRTYEQMTYSRWSNWLQKTTHLLIFIVCLGKVCRFIKATVRDGKISIKVYDQTCERILPGSNIQFRARDERGITFHPEHNLAIPGSTFSENTAPNWRAKKSRLISGRLEPAIRYISLAYNNSNGSYKPQHTKKSVDTSSRQNMRKLRPWAAD